MVESIYSEGPLKKARGSWLITELRHARKRIEQRFNSTNPLSKEKDKGLSRYQLDLQIIEAEIDARIPPRD